MSWAEDYHAELVKRATAATEIEDDEEALRAFLAVTDRSTILSDLAAGVAKNSRFGTAFGERNSHALHEAERVIQPREGVGEVVLQVARLGTVWGEELARHMLSDAGFGSVEVVVSPRPQNCIYIWRPGVSAAPMSSVPNGAS